MPVCKVPSLKPLSSMSNKPLVKSPLSYLEPPPFFDALSLISVVVANLAWRRRHQKKALDVQAIMGELMGLQRTNAPLENTSTSALIDHVLARYHAVHREQLPELIRMARRVEAVHRDHPLVPNGLTVLLEEAEQDLLSHMMKEENILFPMLKAGGNPFVSQPISMMRSEHSQHGAMLEQLMALCDNANAPQGACNTWRALYAGISQLHEDLLNHIHLENNILFSQFELPAPEFKASACCGACC